MKMQTARVCASPPHALAIGAVQLHEVFQSAPAYRTHRAGTRDTPQAAAETWDNAKPHSAGHRSVSAIATAATAHRLSVAAIGARVPQLRGIFPQIKPSCPAAATPGPSLRPIPQETNRDREAHRCLESAAQNRRRPRES